MSGAPSSSESAPVRPAQTDVSADAALILAALGRMEAVVRDERAAFTRLRVMLGDMAQAIARGKAVADSETAATLLDELEHRVDAMIDIAGPGPVAEAAPIPDPRPPSSEAQHAGAAPDAAAAAQAIQHPAGPDQVPTVSDVVSRLGSDDETPPTAEMPVDDTGTGAPTVAMLTAMVEALRDSISATTPEPEAALENPTPQAAEAAQPLDAAPPPETSSIESAEVATPAAEIAHADEAAHFAEALRAEAPQAVEATHPGEAAETTDIPPPAAAAPDNSAFVAMLRARLAALQAASAAAAPEPEAPVAEVAAQPLDLTPRPETLSIEISEVATPAAEIAQVAEAAQEAADIPPPADPAPDNSAFVAMLNARLAELHATAAAAEHDAPLEAPQPALQTAEAVAQPLDVAPPSETSSIESAEPATPAAIPGPAVTDLHESALLASLEQMGTRPFPPPDEGTAVIFAPKPEFEFPPEFAREPMAHAESQHAPLHAIEPEPAAAEPTMAEILSDLTQSVAPAPAALAVEVAALDDVEPTTQLEPTVGPAAAVAPSDAVAAAETAESDFDPADFLFGPEPEPDPAAFLLDPAPPQPPALRAKADVPAQPEFAARSAKPAAENPDTSPPAEPDSPAQTTPDPHDPLRALKALSENEKLALFS